MIPIKQLRNADYENVIEFSIVEEQVGERIDKFLAEVLETDNIASFSRTYVQKLITDGNVLVNGNNIKANYKLVLDDIIRIMIPFPEEYTIEPEDIPLDIIYEDEDVILINKPKGMVVHPSAGHYTGTLVNALMYHCDNLSGINGVMRTGIVHRIDMNTTGVLVACKNDAAHLSLSAQLKEHSITRYYYAICHNRFNEESGTVNAPIGRHPLERKKMAINVKRGKDAITHYQVLENFDNYAFIKCKLETGRTHQIRVHMSSISHPLLGDNVYCRARSSFSVVGQTLHAGVLGFVHPRTGEYMEFEAPLPDYFEAILAKLRS